MREAASGRSGGNLPTVVAELASRTTERVGCPPLVKGGNTYRILSDQVGSVRLVVNVATGAVAQRIDYDAWGSPTYVTGSPNFQPFGFAGGLYDPNTSLIRFGARDYDPRVGRWTSKDPMGFRAGEANFFAYVMNDPINLVDPFGLTAASAARCFGRGLAAGAAGGAAVAAAAFAAAAMLPTAAVTAGLGLAAVGGAAALGLDLGTSISLRNWDRVAYDLGAAVGGAGVGGAAGRAVATRVSGAPSGRWSLGSDWAQGYNPKLGSLSDWLGTGPNPASAAFSLGVAGAGGAEALPDCSCSSD